MFWGSIGKYHKSVWDDMNEKVIVYEEMINIEYNMEQQEIVMQLPLEILSAGPKFLECYVGEYLLGRRSLYCGEVSSSKVAPSAKDLSRDLIEKHRSCSDPLLSSVRAAVDFFVLCDKCTLKGMQYEFTGEIKAYYADKYPFNFKINIATGIRLPRGEHHVRIDLLNVVTGNRLNLTKNVITAKSDCLGEMFCGDLFASIPEPGLYCFNLYVDEEFITSTVLPIENSKPMFSYALRKEDMERVANGEHIKLLKRSAESKK